MGMLKAFTRRASWIGPLLVALLVAGCAGIESYEPHDYRREGPKQGLISGPAGEFVIYRRTDEPAASSETRKNPEETADGEEQKDGE
jgi:hypothetical protein